MVRSILKMTVALGVLAGAYGVAQAADMPPQGAEPAAPLAVEQSSWMLRLRALAVIPRDSASLKLDGNHIDGGSVNVTNAVIPELDITYFFTKNIAAELILGTTPHSAKAAGSIHSVGPIGRAWLLPPTLTLQYHFNVTDQLKPYIGAGVNYTFFYNQKERGDFTTFSLKNSAGFALQAGVDYMFDQHWGINFDVKKIFLRPKVKATLAGQSLVTGKVRLDPWLIGTGVVYRF